ncbi:Pyrimidine-nucleoside phosphorylase [Mesomycoplasma conjunctivae]|uniref:Thymidine phosphorylase n=1 Tax=Mesomycoplasma conjunctivae (strain ATCC 25834 / NCTC 10147 / HRC/581) TaxID=572263 RepID=C5J6Z5_MESCH|nr:thymidine phosphorylase [Mesomycoplasma conjunctivae]CAT05258.1 Thymidine phosphorylase [Mesomycoplasma conjunctivae]VEU66484.1 Pyrimidine-nucleoside phosphorylase [Mesomycoplasma conjunctivae]
MNVLDLIDKKVNKEKLNQQEYDFLISQYLEGKIADYQMSSLLMAILLNGMSDEEIFYLTKTFIDSGLTIDLSEVEGIKIDKHSTGGVGDTVSMIIAPIFAALGYKVSKMSGRGLAHTGGTLDKLESIDGLSTSLTDTDFVEQVKKDGIAIISQSESLVPADKKIYALRDVTGTVGSIPLIAVSIMSKKIATGSDVIILDVKCGNGAFMKTLKDAKLLGQKMLAIGKYFGKKTIVQITNMSVPLGRMIGNKNEVLEAISVLSGETSPILSQLCFGIVEKTLIEVAGISATKAKAEIKSVIKSGKALEYFKKMIASQGGDIKKIESSEFWTPTHYYDVKSTQSGYVKWESALAFGKLSSLLGAGRMTKEDKIDNEAGIELKVENGEYVQEDQTLFTLYSSQAIDVNKYKDLISETYSIVPQPHKTKVFLARVE